MQVNNAFNSAEDLVQYALGSMNAYSVRVESEDGNCGACYPGIIAQNHAEALFKYLKYHPEDAQHLLKVNLCE